MEVLINLKLLNSRSFGPPKLVNSQLIVHPSHLGDNRFGLPEILSCTSRSFRRFRGYIHLHYRHKINVSCDKHVPIFWYAFKWIYYFLGKHAAIFWICYGTPCSSNAQCRRMPKITWSEEPPQWCETSFRRWCPPFWEDLGTRRWYLVHPCRRQVASLLWYMNQCQG